MADPMTLLFGWMAVFFILTILSIVFVGDNFWFRISESVLIGATVGNMVLISIETFRSGALYELTRGKLIYLVPIGFGILLFARYTKYNWLSAYGVSILVGTGIGISLRALVYSQFIVQITSTLQDLSLGINGIISFIIVLCVVIYFLFTIIEPTEILNPVRRVGRISMMIAFGAGYISLLISVYSLVISNFQKIVDVIRLTFSF